MDETPRKTWGNPWGIESVGMTQDPKMGWYVSAIFPAIFCGDIPLHEVFKLGEAKIRAKGKV